MPHTYPPRFTTKNILLKEGCSYLTGVAEFSPGKNQDVPNSGIYLPGTYSQL
jgi:hypothetical protein